MRLVETQIHEVTIVETDVHEDHREFLTESDNQKMFEALGLNHQFVQDNHTFSSQSGTILAFGYHEQKENRRWKLS